jgi:hypothetical protein
MSFMNRALAGTLLLVSIPNLLLAQTADLRLRGKVGDRYSYRMTSTISSVGAEGVISWKATFTEKLAKLSNGEFHWATSFKVPSASATGVMKGGDAGVKQLDGITMTLVQNEKGEVLRGLMNGTEVPSKGSSIVTYPGRKTKVGETWNAKIEVGNQLVPIVYRFVSLKKQGWRSVATIVGSFPKGSVATAVKPTRFWVDVANGKMLKAEGDTQMAVQGMKIRVAYTIIRA